MTTRRTLILAAATAAILASPRAFAHEFRPAILDVTELGRGRYEVIWSPAPEGAGGDATVSLPDDCRREAGEGSRSVVDCGPAGLAGRAITVRGLGPFGDAVVRYTGAAGRVTAVLRAESPSFVVPSAEARSSWRARAQSYFAAGVAHILAGGDHLLFVLGLLLLVRGAAALARTITAFTLAHSVTLALAVTSAVSLPPRPVEACIAWSLVLLAGELARDPGDARSTLARRWPSLLAFGFGLLHGFGFAGGLAELHVPRADLPLALAGFNLGVEAGQLAFVAVALAARWILVRAIGGARAARLARAPAYVIGVAGVFLMIDRVAAFWRA